MKRMNKRGQFFILSAVIIAAIIVSITSVHNYISTGDAPKKFYYYSQQLEDETGAVVDYALYSDPTGNGPNSATIKSNMNDFLQQGITKTLQAYPNMELFSCYSNSTNSSTLICQNNGTKMIIANISTSSNDYRNIYGSKDPIVRDWTCGLTGRDGKCLEIGPSSFGSFSIEGKTILTIKVNGTNAFYNIPLGNSSIQRGQFYFIATLNSTGGQYVSQSNDPKTLSS